MNKSNLFGFDEALTAMKRGLCLSRFDWNDGGCITAGMIVGYHDQKLMRLLMVRGDRVEVWFPSQIDILADDWQLIDG